MQKLLMTLLLTLMGSAVFACTTCNKQVQEGIFNSAFFPNLLTMLSAFIVLAVAVAILTAVTTKKHKSRLAANSNIKLLSPVPLTTASMVLGIGLGGFIDGIFLHQILQWHEMLSNRVPVTDVVGKSVNMFWDGIFHFFCFVVVMVGITLLWKLLKRNDVNTSGKLLTGGLILGWGLFNIVEGVIDHQLLKLHNVMEQSVNHDIANFTFLGISVIMLLIGYALVNSQNNQTNTKL